MLIFVDSEIDRKQIQRHIRRSIENTPSSKVLKSYPFLCFNIIETEEVTQKSVYIIRSLERTMSTLEMELEAARISDRSSDFWSERSAKNQSRLQKVFAVIGINTAFSSKKRRDSVRQTWMPTGEKLKKIEKEKGIVVRL